MDKNFAIEMKQHALKSIEHLSAILHLPQFDTLPPELHAQLKRNIGVLIGETQMTILEEIYRFYPELDNLNQPTLPNGIAPHEGKELALMLAGKKQAALFSECLPADFLPYLENGTFGLHTFFHTMNADFVFPSFIIFKPEYKTQADELMSILQNQSAGFHAETERRIGQLLAYEDWQIEAWIQHWQK
ncbi:hypothetical protein [Alysiella crassa]|uniref:Uncharacterized protein n=1 Tax=Alysiella crassa TaxID=153491 RepID=A0A376BNC1_9NEIS|nr:hypothetical protein [Alysiella crassa]UOP06767.1 hypothetical protein LVJ80_13790 [Alysiella crassa]SSY71115.1 Uncharacterised protein [Alysiella crassa]